MIFKLRLKTSWNHVAKKTIEAKDRVELEKKLPDWWQKQFKGNRVTVSERDLK